MSTSLIGLSRNGNRRYALAKYQPPIALKLMKNQTKPKRIGNVQTHQPHLPMSSWLVHDRRAEPGIFLGFVSANDAKEALTLARERWSEQAAILPKTAWHDYLDKTIPDERGHAEAVRPTAYSEAAFAVCLHQYGYTVTEVMLWPTWTVIKASGKLEYAFVGETGLTDLPQRDILLRPEHRLEAEHYMTAVVTGSVAEASVRPIQPFQLKRPPLPRLRDLLEVHGDGRPENYLDRIYAHAESLLTGPVRQQIERVAEALVTGGEMSDDDFRGFLREATLFPPFRTVDPTPGHSGSSAGQNFQPRTSAGVA